MSTTKRVFSLLTSVGLLAAVAPACDARQTDQAPRSAEAAESGPHNQAVAPLCTPGESPLPLPESLRETSGIAVGVRDPQVLWSHNDGDEPVLYALSRDGSLFGQLRIQNVRLQDIEDVAVASCAGGSCLYLADIGDNSSERETIAVHRIPEPDTDDRTATAATFHARYPDGPWDAEAIFVTSAGEIHVVTKGRESPVSVYRYPPGAAPGDTVILELIVQLAPKGLSDEERVTGAASSPDGEWIAVRSNALLQLYRKTELLSGRGSARATTIDLRPLREPQGEGVAFDTGGNIWLTSEAEEDDQRPLLSRLRCSLPTAAASP